MVRGYVYDKLMVQHRRRADHSFEYFHLFFFCRGLLQALGFEVVGTSQDFKASIPVAADLTAMDDAITQLLQEASVPAR
jgi:hypothetical protein